MRIQFCRCDECGSERVACVIDPEAMEKIPKPVCSMCDPKLFRRASEWQKDRWLAGPRAFDYHDMQIENN